MQVRTPSPLKWLAEKRARERHRAERAAKSAEENRLRAERFMHRAEPLLRMAERQETRECKLRQNIEGLDRSLRLYATLSWPPFDIIDPSKIQPVNGWKAVYGRRGTRRAYLIDLLRVNSPLWLTTGEIGQALANRFGVVLSTPQERRRWRSSFRACLKLLGREGLIEDLPALMSGPGTLGSPVMVRWRWKQEEPQTLSQLRQEEKQYCA